VEKETFRPDLYYRIKGSTITIPPLRERPEDIAPLVAHFCEKWNVETGRSRVVLARSVRYLERYPWPGNVRELENEIYELLDLSSQDKITPENLDSKFFSKGDLSHFVNSLALKERLEDVQKNHIVTVMKQARSLREAARLMEISPPSLVRLMRKYQISADKER
jgi:transcriptional regulator with PAS, ATPase and Fis domain